MISTHIVGDDDAPTTELRVLTFNLWGIFIAKLRRERMIAFARKVEHYDIALLQEQFSEDDFELIQAHMPPAVRATRYFRRFPSSFYGSGCAVISRFPIVSELFHAFALQGLPEMVLHGDFFANKGVAFVKVLVPVYNNNNGGGGGTVASSSLRTREVLLYTTHLIATYERVSKLADWRRERYLPFRLCQMIEMAEFIRSTSRPSDCVIIAGDFNCSQHSLELQTLRYLLRRGGYAIESALPPAPPPSRHVAFPLVAGTTSEGGVFVGEHLCTFSPHNAFNASSTSYLKMMNFEEDVPNQIDHLLYSSSQFDTLPYTDCPDAEASVQRATAMAATRFGMAASGVVVFTRNEVVAEAAASLPPASTASTGVMTVAKRYPLSDHYGVAIRLRMLPQRRRHNNNSNDDGDDDAAAAMRKPFVPTALEVAVLHSATAVLEEFGNTTRWQATWLKRLAMLTAGINVLGVVRIAMTTRRQHRLLVQTLKQVYHRGCAQERTSTVAHEALNGAVVSAIGATAAASSSSAASEANTATGNDGFKAKVANVSCRVASEVKKQTMRGLRALYGHTKTLVNKMNNNNNKAGPASGDASTRATATTTEPTMPPLSTSELRQYACDIIAPMSARAMCVFATANTGLAIIAITTLAIGMLHRAGNAKIIDAQLRRLREM